MQKISTADFKFLRDKVKADKEYHEEYFIRRIDPDLIDAYFEGDPDKDFLDKNYQQTPTIRRLTLNRLFPATATLITQLYPQNPRFVASPRRKEDELNAKIASSALNYYFEQMGAEQENQLAIMSAWLYGFGCTKQGWRTVFKINEPVEIDNQQSEGFMSKVKNLVFGKPSMEERENPEYIAEEGPFLNYVNSKDVYFDKDAPFGKGRYFTQHLERSLYEIRTSGLYTLDENFINKYRRGQDERNVKVNLYEQWCWEKDGLYVFVYCDGYDSPLRYDKFPSFSEGFPYKVLAFNQQVNRIYPISHMKVAQRQQRFSDYIITLQKEAIERYKDITIFNSDAFDADDQQAIRANKIGTNVFTKRGVPPAGTHSSVVGANIPKDLFAIQDILNNNIKEILTVIGARVSQEAATTATQQKVAEYGNQLRSMGLEDSVRKFIVAQGKHLLQDLKQFATQPTLLKITGLNLFNPTTQQKVSDEWLETGTVNSPKTLREIIPSEIDITLDMSETARRDLAVVRKQLSEVFAIAMNPMVQAELAKQGKKLNITELMKDIFSNFETLSNPDKYFEDLQPMPAMPQIPGVQENTPMAIPPQIPTGSVSPDRIQQGTEQVNVPQEGAGVL